MKTNVTKMVAVSVTSIFVGAVLRGVIEKLHFKDLVLSQDEYEGKCIDYIDNIPVIIRPRGLKVMGIDEPIAVINGEVWVANNDINIVNVMNIIGQWRISFNHIVTASDELEDVFKADEYVIREGIMNIDAYINLIDDALITEVVYPIERVEHLLEMKGGDLNDEERKEETK